MSNNTKMIDIWIESCTRVMIMHATYQTKVTNDLERNNYVDGINMHG